MSNHDSWNEIRREQGRMHVGCFANGSLATLDDALNDHGVARFDGLTDEKKIEVTKSRVKTIDEKREGRYRVSVPGFGVIGKGRALGCLEDYRRKVDSEEARLGAMLVRLEGRIISEVLAKTEGGRE